MTGHGQEADFLDRAGKITRDRATNVCITVLKRTYIDDRDTVHYECLINSVATGRLAASALLHNHSFEYSNSR